MKILKNKRNNYTVSLEIETDYTDIEKATEPAFQELVKDAKVPGFRQGKVPRNVFEKHYGQELIVSHASSIVMNDCYRKAIEEEKLEPVDYPQNVEVKTMEAGKPFVFAMTVDVKPEVKISKYKGLKVEREDDKIKDADIDKELNQLRDYYAEYKDVDREVKNEDLVGYEIKAFDGEKPVAEWTKEKSGTRVGGNFISEDFDKALLGMKKNETKSFTIKIKADHFMPEVAGKDIKFEVLLTEIKERLLPELNDELAKKASGKDTLAELKAEIKEHMEKDKKAKAEDKFRNDLVLELIKNNDFEIPQAMVEEKLNVMMRNLEADLKQRNMEIKKYAELIGKSIEDIRKEYKPIAENKAKMELILDEVAKKEEIKPTEEALDQELAKLFKRGEKDLTPEEVTKIKAMVPEHTKKEIRNYLTEELALNFVVDNAKAK